MVNPSIGKFVIVRNYSICGQLKNKLGITDTIAIKLKEKYDARVVNCHCVACVCGDCMKILKKKSFEDWDCFFKLGKQIT